MRITFALPYAGLAGGIRVIAIYAQKLKSLGHDVTVVSVPLRLIPLRRKVKSLVCGRGWPPSPTPEPSHFDGIDVPHRVLERFRPIVDRDVPDADVVLATHWTTAPWVQSLSSSKGAKAIFVQGYEALPGEVLPGLDPAWRMPFHKIVISRWLKELAATRFGDYNVSHVPNSVDLAQFHAPMRTKQHEPTVGVLYSRSGFKAFEVGSRAIEIARQTIPQLRVIAFGAEPPAADLPLPEGTEFHYRPAQNSIKEIYSRCDVWLCGSCREGFHLPPLEAMACRCPVVSTRVGGPMDIIEEGINGHLVDVGDSEALAARMIDVLQLSDSAWSAMSVAAHATAERYTWNDATILFEAALATTVRKSKRGDFIAPVQAAAV